MSSAQEAFRLNSVVFSSYEGRAVLDRLTLAGAPGSANRAGRPCRRRKDDRAAAPAALVRPTYGSVHAFGVDLATLSYESLRSHRMQIGYAFESTGLVGNMSIGENIALMLSYHGHSPRRAASKARELAEELQIDEHLDEAPFRANGSVRKRALIARALAAEPKLLLCDEPQVGLTRREATLVSDAIERRRSSRGLTVVFADHDAYLDPFVVTRTFYLENGRLLTAPSIRPPTDRADVPLAERMSMSTALIYRGTT